MDTRFHELTDPEKGTEKRRVGFGAWALLFLSVFAGNYLGLMAGVWFVFSEYYHKILEPVGAWCYLSGVFAGWLAVIHYKMRVLFPVRCVSFLAVVAANILVASHFYQDLLDLERRTYEDPFIKGIIVVMGLLLMPFMQMDLIALRAKYLYSEKTGQWLRYYTTKQRLVVDPGKLLPETVEDVLALEACKKRWRDGSRSQIGLFLDTVPDGEHYFCASFPNKQKFFSLKFSQPKIGVVLFRIDWSQAEQLSARFGEFKKTRFIPVISARAGNELRKRRKLARK